ncbi:hybrid sensor histidine kinase/response regulator [Pseudodonghicola xiamenensis]|uniref:histidine kinase n=1 Tax=Pseudodonghicola xiamenensis TaxID=337702 RepID=A0A8J3MFH9_9RHOB|nr:hybrid sensor histidine kinase/response regulator [Pseudodonghicola xiamenensis]
MPPDSVLYDLWHGVIIRGTEPAVTSRPITVRNLFQLAAPTAARIVGVLVLALCLIVGGVMLAPAGLPQLAALAAGGTLIAVGLGLWVRRQVSRHALSLANDLLEGFIDKDAVPSFVVDAEGRIRARNTAAEKQFPETGEATLAATLRSVFANPSAVLYRLQSRAAQAGAAREVLVTRRGHVRLAVHQMGDQGFLWRVEDMSERPHSARGAEAMPVPVITLGRGGAVLFMNEAARAIVGQRVKSLDRLFPALPVRTGEVNVISTTGGLRDVLVSEFQGAAGRVELFLMPIEGKIGAAKASGFDTLPVPMLKLAPSGRILAANRQAVELLGAPVGSEAMIGSFMQGLGRPIADWLRDTARDAGAHPSEFLRLTRKDREAFVQVSLSRVVEEGEPILIAVMNDATELKSLEAQFVQSQKMQAIGQLAGGIAHDFNNLLTAISGHCDLLLLRHDQGDQDYGDLVQIRQNANRAGSLVGQLLAFSRKQTLRPQVVDLRDTLSDLTHLLNRLVGEKVTLTLSHDPVLRPIRADKRQLEQVLMNLVVNARDAMPQGGEIRIETEVLSLDMPLERDRATVPAGDYVTVKVRDEGVGIPRDKLQKIFEPFYTTKRTGEGTGLGLSTAYGIIKQTGGYIFVDSVEGVGTEFTLYFPAYEPREEDQPAPQAAPEAEAPQQGEGVILLVEDEAPVRAFASRALRLRGYTVLEAESAEDALEILEDPGLMVDVFVTDVVMPGMDGPSWVRKAQDQRPDVKVVFVSGYAEGAFEEDAPEVPNSVFLPKPFSLTQLAETVYQQMHRPRLH